MSLMGLRRSDEEWAAIIEDYRRSGKSVRAYSQEKSINQKTLSNHTRGNRGIKSNVNIKRRNLDEWAILIRDQIISGLSLNDWCKEKGISVTAMRDAERKIRTAEAGKPQNWVQAEMAEEKNIPITNGGRILVRFSGVEIEADESYPTHKIAEMVERLSRL